MLDTLPPELLQAICTRLDGPDAAHALIALEATCRATRAVATLPLVWQPLYHSRWRRTSLTGERERVNQYGSDYRQRYIARLRLDREAERVIDQLVAAPPHARTSIATRLTSIGRDSWDAIAAKCARGAGVQLNEPGDSWPRRYWSIHSLGLIARHEAVQRACASKYTDMQLEHAVRDLSSFFSGSDVDDIDLIFDLLAQQCREAHVQAQVPLPGEDHFDPEELSIGICQWMAEEGFSPAQGNRFHQLMNHFAHTFLTSHRETLPLSLVVVFVAIARRLGLSAAATNFPDRVVARVHRSADGQDGPDDFFVDVYASNHVPIVRRQTLESNLAARPDIALAEHGQYLGSAPVPITIGRVARNIMNSLRSAQRPSIHDWPDHLSAWYAALSVLALVTDDVDGNFALRIADVTHDAFPLDVQPVIQDVLVPALAPDVARRVELDCARRRRDAVAAETVSLRTPRILYAVGQIVYHRLYSYYGVVFGWHDHCNASSTWINLMDVDRLPGGREQPFYHVFALLEDSSPERYVASCNIVPLHKCPAPPSSSPSPPASSIVSSASTTPDRPSICSVCPSDMPGPLDPPPFWDLAKGFYSPHAQLGRFFECAEEGPNGFGRFVLSEESRRAYPEDDTFARRAIGLSAD